MWPPRDSLEHIHMGFPFGRSGRSPLGLQSSGSYHVPSGGTCFPTNSPFTLAWDVVLVRLASGMHPTCRVQALWSACLTHSQPCGSSSVQTLDPLHAPGSSDTFAECASSWNGTPHSWQGGWHFDYRNKADIHLAGYRAHR